MGQPVNLELFTLTARQLPVFQRDFVIRHSSETGRWHDEQAQADGIHLARFSEHDVI